MYPEPILYRRVLPSLQNYSTPESYLQPVRRTQSGGKEKYTDIEEAKRTVIERFNAENVRYKKFYGVDNTDMSNYDLVLSSKDKTPEALADIVYNAYKKHFKIK